MQFAFYYVQRDDNGRRSRSTRKFTGSREAAVQKLVKIAEQERTTFVSMTEKKPT